MGSNAVQLGRNVTPFRRSLLFPSSG